MDANVYFLQLSGFDLAEVSAEPQYSTSFREHQPATTGMQVDCTELFASWNGQQLIQMESAHTLVMHLPFLATKVQQVYHLRAYRVSKPLTENPTYSQ